LEFGQSNEKNTTTVAFSPLRSVRGTVLPAGSTRVDSTFFPSLSDESSVSAVLTAARARPASRHIQKRRMGERTSAGRREGQGILPPGGAAGFKGNLSPPSPPPRGRSEEHTSELQSQTKRVC